MGIPCLTLCVDVRIYMIFQFYFIGLLRVFHILSLTIIRYMYMQLTHFVSATFLKAQKDILYFFYYMDTFEIMIPFFIVSPYTHLCTY